MRRSLLWLILLTLVAGCGTNESPEAKSENSSSMSQPLPPTPVKTGIVDAQAKGLVDVTATGIDLNEMRVVVTAWAPVELTLPVGLLFISGDAATQNMMLAKTVPVALNGSADNPESREIIVPVYCINRFRDTPSTASSFTLSAGGAETATLRGLAACLEGKAADEKARQMAVWVVSDDLQHLTAQQFAERLVEIHRGEAARLGPVGLSKKWLQRGMNAELAQMVAALPPDQLLQWFDEMRPELLADGRAEFYETRDAARPLLEECLGPQIATLPMFAEAP